MYPSISLADAFGSAELLLRVDELDLACTTLDAIAVVAPDAARLHLFWGWLALARPAVALAAKHFRLSLGRDPLEPLAWHGLAATLPEGKEQLAAAGRAARLASCEAAADLRTGKPELARAPLQQLHVNRPDDQEWTLLLVECLRRLGEEEAARELLAPLLERVPLAAPAALLAAALAKDEATASDFLREAACSDPAWIAARRLWTPQKPPLRLPPPPEVALPEAVAVRIDQIGERPVLLDNGEWRMETVARLIPGRPLLVRGLSTLRQNRPPGSGTGPSDARGTSKSAGERRAAVTVEAKAPPAILRAGTPREPTPEPGYAHGDEVVDVLREVQRATHRLFGRSPVPLAIGDATALLVTQHGALARRYGPGVAAEIERRIGQLKEALEQRGIRGEILLADQPPGGAPVLAPSGDAGAKAVAELIRAARKTIEDNHRHLEAILLIGGDAVIPFHRLANPSQDPDGAVCSDNPYGCAGPSDYVPDVVVARLPDGGADNGELLLALLQRSIEYHEGWLISHAAPASIGLPILRRLVANARAQVPVGAWGASTASWQEPSEIIYREMEGREPLLIFPPATAETLAPGSVPEHGTGRLLYFNLHGLTGGPNWYGQAANPGADDTLPVALTPAHIGELEPASICVSEACYGAEITGRSAGDAMALRLLNQGALAFIGSTATSYGSASPPLGGADILAQQVFLNLHRGHPVGRALLLARDWMAREAAERQGYLDPDDAKTLLSFVLLGDPWATPYAKPVLQSKLALPALEPIVATCRPVQTSTIPPMVVDLAHKLVAKLAPQFHHAQITALGQGRPDHVAKGQAGAIVFSAHTRVPTEDGRHTEQIARITVAHGAARKVLLSR